MRPQISMRKALQDPLLLGHVMLGESWSAWRTLLISAMGEKLTDSEREIFTRMTGREHEPEQRVSEFACGVGRRGGKSSAIGAACAYIRRCARSRRARSSSLRCRRFT